LPENSLPLQKNRQKTEMISLSYDVNDHVFLNQNHLTSLGFSQYEKLNGY